MTWWWVLVLSLQVQVPGACEGQLVTLDRHRAAAFATADVTRLEEVYTVDSPSRERDTEVIEQYRERGATVIGALPRISECTVLDRSSTRLDLEVVDTLGAAHVWWDDGTRTRLPRDQPTRRHLVLRLTENGWRISESREPARS
ncbi:hypothetical protein [Aeromicrobium sp. CF3.5]|uniref:hypothetical protein n=1 Tax=Aeromicrobium sp. CF3.5 TaxID=3373078 RepID=UPI003EE58976